MLAYFNSARRWSPGMLVALSACLGDLANPVGQGGAVIEFFPRDTTVYAGASFQAQANMLNAYGDLYPSDHIEYTALDQIVSVTRGGRVTGEAIGRTGVIAFRGDVVDTGWVSVVPVGTLALSHAGESSFVDIVNVDGSGFHRVAPSGQFRGGAPAWLPAGAGLIYQDATPGGAGWTVLYRTDLHGNRAVLLPPGPASTRDQKFPRVSPDGLWVYFTLDAEIWRSHPDGTALEQMTDLDGVPGQDTHPDPSPDGTQLLFASDRFPQEGFELVVRDLAGGNDQPLGIQGLLPRWSPGGDRIAYWSGDQNVGVGSLFVVQSDGSEAAMIPPTDRIYLPEGLDWSADGEWLVARGASTLELIHVATGQVLPLGYSGTSLWASWKR